MTDCDVCIEPFGKISSKKRAKCPYCDIKVCVKCTQKYLIESYEDPHCMGCRKSWSREVMDSFCQLTWLEKEFKLHRQTILIDRERSRLPAAQIVVERQKEAEARRPFAEKLLAAWTEAQRVADLALQKYHGELSRISYLSRGEEPVFDGADAKKKAEEERKVFIMPCPATGCRGFLSTAYKCGVCDIYACPDCHELKGVVKDCDHTCNPDTVASVKAMKKECRNCPECGTNIFKVVGCDQMFCTQCHTPFDWKTGKKITNGAIHNPHYFDYIRQLDNGHMPRQPGDIPCGDGLPTAWRFDSVVRRVAIDEKVRTPIWTALNTFTHIRHVEIGRNTNHAEDTDNTQVNVRYLKKEITEKQWKQFLQTREKRRMRRDEMRQRMEAICGAASDVYGMYMQKTARFVDRTRTAQISFDEGKELVKSTQELFGQVKKLREIFNAEMHSLSYRYRVQMPMINEDFRWDKQKASRKKGSAGSEDSDDGDE
jgi:hypothetical protein